MNPLFLRATSPRRDLPQAIDTPSLKLKVTCVLLASLSVLMARGAHSTAAWEWGVQAGEEFCCFRSAREVQIIIAPLLAAGGATGCGGWLGWGGRPTEIS